MTAASVQQTDTREMQANKQIKLMHVAVIQGCQKSS